MNVFDVLTIFMIDTFIFLGVLSLYSWSGAPMWLGIVFGLILVGVNMLVYMYGLKGLKKRYGEMCKELWGGKDE